MAAYGSNQEPNTASCSSSAACLSAPPALSWKARVFPDIKCIADVTLVLFLFVRAGELDLPRLSGAVVKFVPPAPQHRYRHEQPVLRSSRRPSGCWCRAGGFHLEPAARLSWRANCSGNLIRTSGQSPWDSDPASARAANPSHITPQRCGMPACSCRNDRRSLQMRAARRRRRVPARRR